MNLFADMGVLPGNAWAGCRWRPRRTPAPDRAITAPAAGATVPNGSLVTVRGTAADAGGRVAAVEVSTDNGTTWHPRHRHHLLVVHVRRDRHRVADHAGTGRRRQRQHRTVAGHPVGGPQRRRPRCSAHGCRRHRPPTTPAMCPWDCASPPRPTGTSPASASTRAPATPAPTPARCGPPPAPSWRPARSPARRRPAGRRSRSPRRSRSAAGNTYVASYYAPNGHYAADDRFFFSYDRPRRSAADRAAQLGGNGNGVYRGGDGFPTASYQPTQLLRRRHFRRQRQRAAHGGDGQPAGRTRPVCPPPSHPSVNVLQVSSTRRRSSSPSKTAPACRSPAPPRTTTPRRRRPSRRRRRWPAVSGTRPTVLGRRPAGARHGSARRRGRSHRPRTRRCRRLFAAERHAGRPRPNPTAAR